MAAIGPRPLRAIVRPPRPHRMMGVKDSIERMSQAPAAFRSQDGLRLDDPATRYATKDGINWLIIIEN